MANLSGCQLQPDEIFVLAQKSLNYESSTLGRGEMWLQQFALRVKVAPFNSCMAVTEEKVEVTTTTTKFPPCGQVQKLR